MTSTTVPPQDWSGAERRSLPIHIINWVKDEVKDSTASMEALLKAHTEDEMDRYDQIIRQIRDNNTKSEERHDVTQSFVQSNQAKIEHLQQSITSFMDGTADFHAAIKRAFPKDTEGNPDYDGHRGAHLAWIDEAKESKELRGYIKKVVLGAAAVALTSWLTLLIWQGVLLGPAK